MPDFDLSMVVRAEDAGASATGAALEQTVDRIASAQDRAATSAGNLASASARTAQAMAAGTSATRGAAASTGGLDEATRKGAGSSADYQKRLKAQADALNQVIRATNPTVSNQALLDAALRRVQTAFIQGKVSAELYAKAQDVASRATFNSSTAMNAHARASGGSRIAQMEYMHVARAAIDQFAVGTPLLQIFTMHLAQLAQAYSFSAMSANDNARATGAAASAAETSTAAIEGEVAATSAVAGANAEAAAAAIAASTATKGNAAAAAGAGAAKVVEAEATGVATVSTEANTVATAENAVASEAASVASRGFAGVMAGPWGMAIIAAVTILGALATKLFEAGDAADKTGDRMKALAESADTVSAAQSSLGKIVDLITGKFDNQNVVLREAIRLQAILAQQTAYKEAQKAGKALAGMSPAPMLDEEGSPTSGIDFSGAMGDRMPTPARDNPGVASFRRLVAGYRSNAKASVVDFRKTLEGMAARGELKGLDVNAALEQAIQIAVSRSEYSTNKDVQRVAEGGPLPDYLKKDPPKKRERKTRTKKTPDLSVMGLNIDEQIHQIATAFTDTPPQVEKVRHSVAELDKIMVELAKKKPPNFQALIAEAKQAKDIVLNGINKPYNDFILKQNDALGVQQLLTQGRVDEAEAMKIVLELERQQGPLTAAQKDGVLATVQALRLEQKEQEILQEKQQKYLAALAQVKDAVKGVFLDPVKGVEDLPKKLIGAFSQLRAEKLFESMFGNTFRELQDKITGADVAKDAAERMATAVDTVTAQTTKTTAALDALASSATRAAGGVGGNPTLDAKGSRLASLESTVAGLDGGAANDNGFDWQGFAYGGFGGAAGLAGGLGGASRTPTNNAANGGTIVVTGTRSTAQNFSGWIEKLSKGVGISDTAAASIGKFAGKGIEGAATGALTNSFLQPLGKALGFRTSEVGAQIGGAIGSFIPIPGGQIIGSIAGSLLGGLLSKPKPKSGGAVITSAYDPFSATGNNADAKKVAGGAAGDVQSGILNIAQQLGGQVGSFKISIGEADGKWSVDPLGLNRSAKPGKGGVAFGDDQAAATAFAIQTAVAQGAVTGLSKAVAAALQSSTDVNKALQEALNVKNLETLIGGLGSQLASQFQNYDAQAAERVRLAKKYGLDLLAVEKINGEQRAKLVDDITKQRIGSLLDFQKEMRFGDLFEGDAATRRNAILTDISKVIPDAEAGKDGSSQDLSDLYKQLLSTSRDAFGTAGPEYAADRDAASNEIDRVIQIENDRIAAAAAGQKEQTDLMAANNNLTNETNDLIAITNSKIDGLIATVAGSVGLGSSGDDVGNLARFTPVRSLAY